MLPDSGTNGLADVYEALGITDDDHISVCWKTGEGKLHTIITTKDLAPDLVQNHIGDVYFGVNPVDLPLGRNGKRGNENDVSRVVALYADLDVKSGACPDIATAKAIIDDVSALIHERPVAVIHSGGGLQPLWAVENCDQETGRKLLRRFGRLVKRVAGDHNVNVDNVFDIARILRAPGTLNHKYTPPAPTKLVLDTGGPMSPSAIAEWMDEVGISEMSDDGDTRTDFVVRPDEFAYSASGLWCSYARVTVQGWGADLPQAGRHPFMVSRFVRLAAMWRNGCIPDKRALRTVQTLIGECHTTFCTTMEPRRRVKQYELRSAWEWAVDHVSRMSDERVRLELGKRDHNHGSDEDDEGDPIGVGDLQESCVLAPVDLTEIDQGFWDSRASLKTIYEASMARMCSPWAVLGHCAARALALVRPNAQLPPLIGGPGSLNWFCAVASASGGGKGSASAVAKALVEEPVLTRNLGSGEGIVDSYVRPAR